jgi:hypothetical protein
MQILTQNMELHLKFIGIALACLAWVHLIFPSYFNWKEDLAPLTLVNKQLMYVHTFFIALAVFLMGIFCFLFSDDILNTILGHRISAGFAIFWGFRLFFQFFVYSPKLWRGKIFETVVHIVFSLFWAYLTAIFFIISIRP